MTDKQWLARYYPDLTTTETESIIERIAIMVADGIPENLARERASE